MKKIVFILLTVVGITVVALPTQTPNGGTGKSNPESATITTTESVNLPADINLQNSYNQSVDYPNSDIVLNESGEITFSNSTDDETALGIDPTIGILTTLGLRIVPDGNNDVRFNVTTDPASTIFEVLSSDKGTIPYPAMTQAQESAIGGTKPTGLGVFNTDTGFLDLWLGSSWTSLVNSTSNQTIGGTKTFTNPIIADIGGVASKANSINTQQVSANVTVYPLFAPSSSNGYQQAQLGLGLTFNPFTNNLTTTTFTGALAGNATTATNGVVTTGSYSDPSWITSLSGSKLTATSVDLTSKVTGDLPFANAGFGFHTATLGDIFYASALNTPGKLADVATGQVLTSGGVGVAPAYSATPTLTSLTLPNGQGLVLGATTANQITITSAAGAGNRADIVLNRNDFTNGNNRFFFQTNTTNEWSNGLRGGSGDYQIFDEVNSVSQLRMTQAAGTTAVSTFAGQVKINGLGGINSLVATDASKQLTTTTSAISPSFAALTINTNDLTMSAGNLIVSAANKGLTIKSAAVVTGTANAAIITGVALVGGTVTINDSYVNTSTVCYFSVVTTGGTPGTAYGVTVASGTLTVQSTSALDTSTGNVACLKGN